ncbi:cellulose binding domain-containing protein [Micromonospora sp. HK10]|uniref:cellulose binding domain-containing protein n=1 Tax=Micromonospora sp. HK10 TaxID=1538294 RepID=UPI000626F954|nr:cellulose binding domain-containing protein [Micromonospora sp. HK10]KKJ93834.1 cellulose-binding protein [Micromonospora sp. HK10]
MSRTRRARPSAGAAIASSPWIVVSIGVLVMVVLLLVALGATRSRRPYADAPPPDGRMTLPALTATTASAPPTSAAAPVAPRVSPRSTVLSGRPTPSGSATRTAGGGRAVPSRSATPPPASAASPAGSSPVIGRYGVVTSFDGGFIGQVRLTNTAGAAQGWTVRLSFPRGRITTSWVESAEQGTGTVVDGVFTYRSGVDLRPGEVVRLRFHAENTGTTRPVSCTVDGVPCTAG